MPATVGGRPGLRLPLVSYFLAASLRCQASSVGGVTGKISVPSAGEERCQRGEPCPVGRLVPDPAGVTAQHRVLVPEYQQLSLLRLLPAQHQHGQAEYPANQQSAILSSTRPANYHRVLAAGDGAGQPLNRFFERHRIHLRSVSALIPSRPATAVIAAYSDG